MHWLFERIVPRRLGRDYRWLMGSSWSSNLGDGVMLAAAPLLIASMTSSPILVASGAIMQFLPWLIFGLLSGAIADRFNRRRLVMLANGVRVLIIGALLVFLTTGLANIWVVLVIAFFFGVAEVFADTTASTLLPMMVKSEDLGIANSRLQAGYIVMNQFAGPPLGAFLFALGSFWPFVLQILCVLLALMLVSRIKNTPVPPRESAERTTVRADISDGVKWLLRNPPVRMLVTVILVFNITWAAPWGVLVLYATEYLKMGEVGYGMLTTASAVGGLIAVSIFGFLQNRFSFTTIMRVCLSLEVLMHLAFALTTTGYVALMIMVVFGCYAFLWGAISTTIRQRLVPAQLQGRIASVNMVGIFGGLIVGQAIGGVIAQVWGPTAPWWFAFVGSAITLAFFWRPLKHIGAAPAVPQTRADAPSE